MIATVLCVVAGVMLLALTAFILRKKLKVESLPEKQNAADQAAQAALLAAKGGVSPTSSSPVAQSNWSDWVKIQLISSERLQGWWQWWKALQGPKAIAAIIVLLFVAGKFVFAGDEWAALTSLALAGWMLYELLIKVEWERNRFRKSLIVILAVVITILGYKLTIGRPTPVELAAQAAMSSQRQHKIEPIEGEILTLQELAKRDTLTPDQVSKLIDLVNGERQIRSVFPPEELIDYWYHFLKWCDFSGFWNALQSGTSGAGIKSIGVLVFRPILTLAIIAMIIFCFIRYHGLRAGRNIFVIVLVLFLVWLWSMSGTTFLMSR